MGSTETAQNRFTPEQATALKATHHYNHGVWAEASLPHPLARPPGASQAMPAHSRAPRCGPVCTRPTRLPRTPSRGAGVSQEHRRGLGLSLGLFTPVSSAGGGMRTPATAATMGSPVLGPSFRHFTPTPRLPLST